VTFYRSRGEHGLPIFGCRIATALLLFWFFSLAFGWHHRVRRRSCVSRRQPDYTIPVVVGTRMTSYRISSSSTAQVGAFAQLVLTFLSRHLRPQWLPAGVALVRMRTALWSLLALEIQPIPGPAFDRISKRGYSFRIPGIRCQISAWRQLSEQRPCGLLPTPCV